jgi:hypothetical protein
VRGGGKQGTPGDVSCIGCFSPGRLLIACFIVESAKAALIVSANLFGSP